MSRVYLDWNATTPPREEVLAAMQVAAREAWGNPSSIHGEGRRAKRELEETREALAALVGRDSRDVVFTGSATEANNLVLHATFARRPGVLVTSRTEHPSVVRAAERLAAQERAVVAWVSVGPSGVLNPADVRAALARHESHVREKQVPVLVTAQAVNHETGIVQPIGELLEAARTFGARLHVDAVQAVGKVRLDLAHVDSLAVAPHKLRGPKGMAALLTNATHELVPLLVGGAQERGFRPATPCASLAAGCRVAFAFASNMPERYAALAPLRDRFEARALELWPGAFVVGAGSVRVPHVTSVVFPGAEGPELVASLDLEGVAVSSGSACSAGTVEPSATVTEMLGRDAARSSLRVSLGETTTAEEIEGALGILARVLGRARG